MDLTKIVKTQWDRSAAVLLSVIGAVFLLVGWIGVSGKSYLAEQAPYIISGGIGGVFFLGLGAVLWISADLRDEWRKLDRIEEALGDGSLRWTEDDSLGSVTLPADSLTNTAELTAVAPAPRARATKATKAATSKPTTTRARAKASE